MKIAIPRETAPHELRVALAPEGTQRLKVRAPDEQEVGLIPAGVRLAGFRSPLPSSDLLAKLAAKRDSALAVELIARPTHASFMYSRNLVALLTPMIKDGDYVVDLADDVIGPCCVTHEGEVRVGQPQAAAKA